LKQKKSFKPTEGELEILQILWELKEATVRTINDKLNEEKEVGYTTTLKILQIMTEKGMVERTKHERSHIYKAVLSQDETQTAMLDRMMETAFGGSAMKLVMQALGNHKPSKDELDQIRELLDSIDEDKNESDK